MPMRIIENGENIGVYISRMLCISLIWLEFWCFKLTQFLYFQLRTAQNLLTITILCAGVRKIKETLKDILSKSNNYEHPKNDQWFEGHDFHMKKLWTLFGFQGRTGEWPWELEIDFIIRLTKYWFAFGFDNFHWKICLDFLGVWGTIRIHPTFMHNFSFANIAD